MTQLKAKATVLIISIGMSYVHKQNDVVHMGSYNNDNAYLGSILAEGFTTMLAYVNMAKITLNKSTQSVSKTTLILYYIWTHTYQMGLTCLSLVKSC